MTNRFQLSLVSVILLVILRVAVGWHFFYEGMWKYKEPDFSAEQYFRAAKGPWAEDFRSRIPDLDGRERLGLLLEEEEKAASTAQTSPEWWGNLNLAATHYGYTEEQKTRANELLTGRLAQAREYAAANAKEIDDYFAELDRLRAFESDPTVRDAPFQQKRIYDKRTELAGKVEPWLKELQRIERSFRADLDGIATPEQRVRGTFPRHRTDLDKINHLTIWITLCVGFCLMVGLFTRFASLVGAFFLAGVVAVMPAIPHLYPPPHPSVGHAMYINKEVLEMLLLVFLSTTAVGRWGGLDFFLHHYLVRPLFGRKQDEPKASKVKK